MDRYLRESKLPLEKSWEAFDRKRLPRKVDVQFDTLLEGSFVDRHENLLAFGNPGSGKTHLLCAIGQELIHRGHRVLFTTCSLLVQELLMAKRELRLARLLKRLAKLRVLPAAVRGRWGAKLRASSGGQFGRPPANGRSAERISADAAVDRPALLLRLWWRGGRRGMAIKGGPPHINNGF